MEPNRDALHLRWLHERLVHVHGENANVDYMIRLREITDKLNGHPVTMVERILETDGEATRGIALSEIEGEAVRFLLDGLGVADLKELHSLVRAGHVLVQTLDDLHRWLGVHGP